MRFGRLVLAALLALGAGSRAFAQQSTLSQVVFRNSGSFRQADLEAVAKLHSGERVTLKQMQDAAQHLIDTGFFEDVNVDSKGTPSGLTLIFVLKPLPSEQVTKVRFENFVWFTPEELRGIVHQVLPLFNGEMPESGASLEQVDAALQAAVVAKGLTGAVVQHEAVMATTADPVHSLAFRVARPSVMENIVRVEGLDPALAPLVSQIATKLTGTPYVEGETQTATLGRLLGPYRDAGYLDAKFADVQVATVPGDTVRVDLTAKLVPGQPYRVKEMQFTETPLVSSAAFAAQAKLHTGDVASRKQLLATLAPVDAAYQKQGYADEYVDTVATADAAMHTVSYAFTVVPGEQYRVRSVNVTGLTPEARAQFDLGWLLKPGDLYDPGYVRSFLTNNTALRGLAAYVGGFKAASDPQTRLVDLTIEFVRTSGKK